MVNGLIISKHPPFIKPVYPEPLERTGRSCPPLSTLRVLGRERMSEIQQKIRMMRRAWRKDSAPGGSAIKRILHQHSLSRPKKRKQVTKQDLRNVKKQWLVFGQLSADTNYLQDIPYERPFMRQLGLPQFQPTVREVVSGLTFIGYADQLAKSYSVLLAERVSAHLAYYGLDLAQVEW